MVLHSKTGLRWGGNRSAASAVLAGCRMRSGAPVGLAVRHIRRARRIVAMGQDGPCRTGPNRLSADGCVSPAGTRDPNAMAWQHAGASGIGQLR